MKAEKKLKLKVINLVLRHVGLAAASSCDGVGKGEVSSLVGAGVGTGGDIELSEGGGTAGGLGGCTVLVGILSGFDNGSRHGTSVIVNSVGGGVGTDDGIGIGQGVWTI